MARVESVGELEWNTNNKGEDLYLVLTLDSSIVEEGKINETATWNWDTDMLSVETLETKVEIEIDDDFEQNKPLMLPREIRYGLRMLSAGLSRCRQLTYSWRGGSRVEICITGYSLSVPRTQALLRVWASRISEATLGMHEYERFDSLVIAAFRETRDKPPLSKKIINDIVRKVQKEIRLLRS